MASGRVISRAQLAGAVLKELDADYRRVVEGAFAGVADEWEAQCSTLGREISVQVGPRIVRGRAETLDDDGALLLRTEHGRLERVLGGDVMQA
jgi:BirA family biotin operon repressor/biotin-[acetyl-CoA-carboxylase] ligase